VFYLERQHDMQRRPEIPEKTAIDSGDDTGQRITLPDLGNQALG
jgi:hypothetical protein